MDEILSATLPKDADIRDTLVAELRERFGERLVVLRGDVFVLPEAFSPRGENGLELGAGALEILSRAGLRLEDGEDVAFVGSDAEKRLSRAILTQATRATRRKSGMVMISRRFSSGEFWIAVAERGGAKHVVFLGRA